MIKKSFNNTNPTLYIVSTPIGNLGDMTKRAIETLKMVDIIACEDTRVTGSLLKLMDIEKTRLMRFDLVTENKAYEQILNELKDGKNVALVSDAGTPIISDPGFPLIKACKNEKINVVPIPGATAFVAALTVSAFDSRFYFYGFLNDKQGKRISELEELKKIKTTLIFYVSPYKLVRTLEDVNTVFGDVEISLAKEITKLHETFFFGTPKEVIKDLGESIKGEYVLLINNR